MKPLPLGLLISGAFISLGGVGIGFILTIVAMIGAFNRLGSAGISDPAALAHQIGHALTATAAGLVITVALGLPLILAGIITHIATRRPAKVG